MNLYALEACYSILHGAMHLNPKCIDYVRWVNGSFFEADQVLMNCGIDKVSRLEEGRGLEVNSSFSQ